MLFQDELHDSFGTWPLAYIPYGGADYGEVKAVADAIGSGDDAAYYTAWLQAADRLAQQAADTLAHGHKQSARDLFLRASSFYAASYHPLYGEPVDPRLIHAFRKQIESMNSGLALFEPAILPLRIPFESISMPAYLVPAEGRANEVRPLIILNGGYDSTVTDTYFASAVAASRRGYHCLLFDGPGQGEMLYEHAVRLRPDWETVISAVVDFAIQQPIVDPTRIALSGASLGGYLAPRGASGEPRIAALIADPGTWSIAGGFKEAAIHKLGVSPEAAANLGTLDDATMQRLDSMIQNNRDLRWKVVQRGFWVHGVSNLRDYFREAERYTMDGRAENIQCPTLLTAAEDDRLSFSAPYFLDALRCPKTLIKFSSAEGAGTHCEMQNRSLFNRKALDWLDEQF
ncbi:S9 family peptidase [Terriglobus sp. TAA 43]|uniref:alpha/beta hydrolase family protein n=1 Tax=Terriglobus sp. TAA 43 TaxID=278961 RepID=UPI0006456D12|nr:alpha/beta fold hydrolase [Terriglobus sp. TAA 43]